MWQGASPATPPACAGALQPLQPRPVPLPAPWERSVPASRRPPFLLQVQAGPFVRGVQPALGAVPQIPALAGVPLFCGAGGAGVCQRQRQHYEHDFPVLRYRLKLSVPAPQLQALGNAVGQFLQKGPAPCRRGCLPASGFGCGGCRTVFQFSQISLRPRACVTDKTDRSRRVGKAPSTLSSRFGACFSGDG